ncbi:hypothetical protein GCM10011309_18200 [Litorimonas cladophorae]|uniref:DUF998 domain-containing protein n=1 Tax=Litorimonas cladophorae TaxID=1220491 RepID=A0A918KN52_9PROT|nr:DUF998 domain-containing protein [Litorimonas cladophorae]GGX68709.1 hypothetical protein GCM10011309_18200 [Litorimonas cladophorae]
MATKPPIWAGLGVIYLILSGIILPEVLGFFRAGYSPVSNYLSELGAVGTSTHTLATYFGFLPVALACLVVLKFLWQALGRTSLISTALVLIGIGIPVGYLGAVFFPCDLGCPVEGSARQAMHNLFGLFAYPLGSLGLILLGSSLPHRKLKAITIFAGAAMALGFVMMLSPEQSDWRGAWQRLGDYSAFIALAILVFTVPKLTPIVSKP